VILDVVRVYFGSFCSESGENGDNLERDYEDEELRSLVGSRSVIGNVPVVCSYHDVPLPLSDQEVRLSHDSRASSVAAKLILLSLPPSLANTRQYHAREEPFAKQLST
jgi:hypothetical protein